MRIPSAAAAVALKRGYDFPIAGGCCEWLEGPERHQQFSCRSIPVARASPGFLLDEWKR
jgi:hypothetical protein